jgi:hypothetical protein
MCLNDTHRKVNIGKQFSNTFPIHSSSNEGGASLPLFFNFSLEYALNKDWN